jgi:hypothetical protein
MYEIEMRFVEAKRTTELTRIYILQLLDAPFAFADEIKQSVAETDMSILDWDEAMLSNLLGDYLPEVFYYFSLPSEEKTHPFLYTGVLDVSIEQGGLLVMQCYLKQILVLCNAKGEVLLSYCHDLELGPNGLVVWRSSRTPIWEGGIFELSDSQYRLNRLSSDWAQNLFGMQLYGRDRLQVSHPRDNELSVYSEDALTEVERIFKSGKGDEDTFVMILNDVGIDAWFSAPWFKKFLDNPNSALLAVKRDFKVFTLLNEQLKSKDEIQNAFLARASFQLVKAVEIAYDLNFYLWSSSSLYMKWLESCTWVYEHMPENLKRNEAILIEFVRHSFSFTAIPDDLLEDKDLMLKCVSINGALLCALNYDFKSNAELVLAAVKNNGSALMYASNELKDNYEIVAEAVNSSEGAFQFASARLQQDPGLIALVHARNSNDELPFLSKKLLDHSLIIPIPPLVV